MKHIVDIWGHILEVYPLNRSTSPTLNGLHDCQFQALRAETERLRAADVAATLLLSEKEEAESGDSTQQPNLGVKHPTLGFMDLKFRFKWQEPEVFLAVPRIYRQT